MEEFLHTTKFAASKLSEGGAVHVVLGNESSDLDSTVCALVYAYYLHKTSSEVCLYLPILNIPRAKYRLRTEICYLLGSHGITSDLLTFTDDIDLKSLPHLQLTLVDHHVLSHQLSPLDQYVVRVIDHRPVEKQWDSRKGLACPVADPMDHDETLTASESGSISRPMSPDADFSLPPGTVISTPIRPAHCHRPVPQVDASLIVPEANTPRERLQPDLSSLLPCVDPPGSFVDLMELDGQQDEWDELKRKTQQEEVFISVASRIALVGSCATLVTEEISSDDNFSLDPITATLLTGTILTDTINLSEAAGKTTPQDIAALEKLKQILPDVDMQSLYDVIHKAKADLSDLSSHELLEKDLKLVSGPTMSIAMSSIMMAGNDLVVREDLSSTLSEFSTHQAVAAVVIMTLTTQGDQGIPQRDLIVYSTNRIYRQQITDVLGTCANPCLQLEPVREVTGDIIIFKQGNVHASRKKVMPILKAFLNGEKTPDESSTVCIEPFVSGSQDGFSSLVDLSDSGKGESQGESDKQTHNERVDVLSSDPFDLFDPICPLLSETSASSEGQEISPANQLEHLDAGFLGNQRSEKEASTDSAVNDNGDRSNLNCFDVVSHEMGSCTEDVNHSNRQNRYDPFSLKSPAVNKTGDNLASLDFIDNLIDTKADDFELTEADVLHPLLAQDFLIPGLESPMDMSSGQNSGQASKVSSYPVTPPNSFMDSTGSGFIKEHNLPSFNSSEMVERIKAKKASLGDVRDEVDVNDGLEEGNDSTFTPQNSFSESSMDKYLKETELPSFYNSEMVQRIKQKRASLENAVNDVEDIQDDSEDRFPWTPHNSYVETSMDRFGRENLPSFNNAEMVRKIQEKRASLPSLDENENEAGASGSEEAEQPTSVPYTPQNSCTDGDDGSHGGGTDMSQVADRLAGAGAEPHTFTADTDNLNQNRLLNMLDSDNTTAAFDNVVSNLIAQEMLSEIHTNEVKQENFPEASNQDFLGNIVAAGFAGKDNNINSVFKSANSVSNEGQTNGEGIEQNRISQGMNEEDQLSEAVMNEVAFSLASELIQMALETFSLSLEPSEPEVPQQELDQQMTIKQENGVTGGPSTSPSPWETDSHLKTLSKSDSNSISVETEYLPEMDPLHGNMDIVESTSLETDAVREVVESSSFRKISSHESSTGHEEIAENLLREIEANRHKEEMAGEDTPIDLVRKHINIDPDLCLPIVENSQPLLKSEENINRDKEPLKKKVIHVKDRGQFHFSISSDVAESLNDSGVDNSDNQSGAGHHFSGSADGRKEVYMTTAGRISIGVDQDVERSDSLGQGTTDIAVSDTQADISLQVGDIAQHDVDVVTVSPDEDVLHPLPKPCTTFDPVPTPNPTSTRESEACQPDLTSPACHQIPADTTAPANPAHLSTTPEKVLFEVMKIEKSQERMKGVEGKDEWQDDGFPGLLTEDAQGTGARPRNLGSASDVHAKKKIVPDLNLLSDEDVSEGDLLENIDDLETPNDLDTPDDLDDSDMGELEWERRKCILVPQGRLIFNRFETSTDDTPVLSPGDAHADLIPEYTEQEEKEDARHWKTVTVGDRQFRIDLRVIEPYKKVLSHGGYYGDGLNAIILFSGCYLPDRRRKDYNYVMDNLFYYVVHTLEQLVAEDYMIVYFHGATPRKQMPGLSWLKKCYQMIDRRLRKNLKALLLVHPTLWLKTVVMMTRPFISAKFSSKLRFVRTLHDLSQLVPMEHVYVPDQVNSYDASLHSRTSLSTPSSPHSDPASP